MSGRIRNIVVGIAAIQDQDPHLARAIDLADALGASLHVVHAFALPDPILYPYPEMAFIDPESVARLRQQTQSRLESQVRVHSVSEKVHVHALPAPPDLAVLDIADDTEADLLIVGATRHGAVTRRIVGTTAQRVVRAASVPVLVSRGGPHGSARRILLATDLSRNSEEVLRVGIELATSLAQSEELELRCLLAVDYDLSILPPIAPGEVREMAEGQLADFLEKAGLNGRGIAKAVRVGKPSREIIADAEEFGADLLVLGTHGRTGATRFLIGSVAESALRSAPCDVLVIPTLALEAGDRAAE